ncbi:MAG: PEGA domain-containing protein [Candidatus Aminicenantes bacterium]|nr:PEGA domain-containing protein [Candidatus Aminicenantes bacterium]
MITQRKTQIILALLVSSVFLLQSCTTIIRGTTQKIPITSNPMGAKIIVDGLEKGNTPIELKLERKKNHIIRIEKQGYNPFEVIITRKSSLSILGSILGNYCLGYILGGYMGALLGKLLLAEEPEQGIGWFVGMILGWAGAIAVDFSTGANYNLNPGNLILTLIKIERKPQPNFILIDGEQFQNIKWIRIKFSDSDKEEIVNIDGSSPI